MTFMFLVALGFLCDNTDKTIAPIDRPLHPWTSNTTVLQSKYKCEKNKMQVISQIHENIQGQWLTACAGPVPGTSTELFMRTIGPY